MCTCSVSKSSDPSVVSIELETDSSSTAEKYVFIGFKFVLAGHLQQYELTIIIIIRKYTQLNVAQV